MRFTAIQKADVADDADPRAGTPLVTTSGRVFTIRPYADRGGKMATQSVIMYVRVKVLAGTLAANGGAILTLYVYDEVGTKWIKVDASTALLNDQLYAIGIPASSAGTIAYIQVSSVVGTSADHVEIRWLEGGAIPPDLNIGSVHVDVGSATGLATSAKQDTAQTSLTAIASGAAPATAPINTSVALTGSAAAVASGATSAAKHGIWICNPLGGAGPVYVGAAGVTAATGIELQPGDRERFGYLDRAALYLFAPTTTTVAVMVE